MGFGIRMLEKTELNTDDMKWKVEGKQDAIILRYIILYNTIKQKCCKV